MNETEAKKQVYLINMIAILEDMQDQYMTELQPLLRHNMKRVMNQTHLHTRNFIKYCDRTFSDEPQVNFGEAADEMRKILDEIYLKRVLEPISLQEKP